MASQYSKNGAYYARLSLDGKLQIWNTASGIREQEYVPNFHLTSPCTCLHFIERNTSVKNGSPRKKKRRDSVDGHSPYVALGTTSGSLLVYSIVKAELELKVDNPSKQSVSCLSWNFGDHVYSGAGDHIIIWDLEQKRVKRKWKAGDEHITSVLVLPNEENVLSAARSIKLWNIEKEQLIRTFTGHMSQVTMMQFINPIGTNCMYFVSAGKGDRVMNCWNIEQSTSQKNAVVSFLLEDSCRAVSITFGEDGTTYMAAVTDSGVVHIYSHTLNGKCNKPLKPKTTVRVVSDTGQSTTTRPQPISIDNAYFLDYTTLKIAYGNTLLLKFENFAVSFKEKVHCLIRETMNSKPTKASGDSKTTNSVDNSVQYVTPFVPSSLAVKRKNSGKFEVPMEKRLENLQVRKIDGEKVPQFNHVANLLVQGLHSNDMNILKQVFSQSKEEVVRNTVKRLPMPVIVPLLKELNVLIQGKSALSKIGALWLKNVLKYHAGLLTSNPSLKDLIEPISGYIETRLTLHTSLNRLKGRLDLITSQVSIAKDVESINSTALLSYTDKELDEVKSEIMDLGGHSDSDIEWAEDSSEDEQMEESEDSSDID